MYTYNDGYAPGETYKIRINKITKVMHGKFKHQCSTVDNCDKTYRYSVKLTKDEYKKVMKLWNNKKTLSPILESICENNKVLAKSCEEWEKEFYGDLEECKEFDLNSDGKITSREFGDVSLGYALEGK